MSGNQNQKESETEEGNWCVGVTRMSSGSGSTSTEKPSAGLTGRCISCAGEASTNIVRDENFGKVMRFYWEGLSVDVKPKESKSHELCADCWDDMVEFYDTNDVLVLMEKHLSSLQKTLIGQSLKGIEKLKTSGLPLLPVHKLVVESKLELN